MCRIKIRNYFIIIFNALIFLTPLYEYLNIIFYLSLLLVASILLITSFKKNNLEILSITLIFSVLYYGLFKGIFAALIFIVAYINYKNYYINNLKSTYILIYINFLLLLMQFIGIDEAVYLHTNYANDSAPNIMYTNENFTLYLPQVRPSGIFPAPTFISFFLIFTIVNSIYFRYNINRYTLLLIGAMLSIAGSTMGLLIFCLYCILALFYVRKFIYVLVGYITTMLIYYIFLPETFAINFSFDDIYSSTLDRDLSESIITNNFLFLVLIAFILISFIVLNYKIIKKNLLEFISGGIIILLPTLLHDSSNSLLGFYFFGIGLGIFKFAINQNKIYEK